MSTKPNPALKSLASDAWQDYLVACNVTDSLDHFNATPLERELWLLARSLENGRAMAANSVMSAAYGSAHALIDENA
jgi:hypothetical protein